MILASPFFTLLRLLAHLFGALTGQGASGKFSREHSILRAMSILIKAWRAALAALPGVLRQRRALSPLRRLSRAGLYNLFCKYRISACEVALKE
jgi:hypothetical protein